MSGTKQSLSAASGLLPPGVTEVGIIPDDQGWHAYCEYGAAGGFLDSGQTKFIHADRGTGSAIAELAAWMHAQWRFDEERAREVAWRLLEAAADRVR